MIRLYREYLYVPKQGKVREKVLITRMILTIVFIIACLTAMSITAYAYFSESVASSSNVIRAATFDLSVTAEDSGENVAVTSIGGGKYTAILQAGKSYTVTLAPGGTAKTGFCVLTAVGCSDTYHTCQLGADTSAPGGKRNSYSFTLSVTADTKVTFLAHWGTSSYYGYTSAYYISGDNASVEMTVVGSAIGNAPQQQQSPAPNMPDTPDTVDEPDTPDTVDTPDTPDTPNTVDTPDTPDTADEPGQEG